ncbi:hypothetical protein GORHZ_096_00120 [Gordonia rhizosphera NBRC 16068]|uniref:Uncharacterized protein n=1 Tax=Gordonia rhizosphera NBRC 16068 TaxID=1108045 RepID=K6WDS5_9ACTN|nr:hypothetical protein GORHZ_096_00120 [Gordonia rhizosphera NBRC 16068]
MGVQVDETGQQDRAAALDAVGAVRCGQIGADLADLAVDDEDVDGVTLPVGPDIGDEDRT